MTSPMHQHSRSTSTSLSMKKPQTKAAAQRLAEVMAHQAVDDEEEEDELYDLNSSAGIGLAGGRQARNRSPMSVRNSVDQAPSSRPIAGARGAASLEQQPSSARLRPAKPLEPSPAVEQPSSARHRPAQPSSTAEQQQPSSARYRHARSKPLEPSSNAASVEQQQPSSARTLASVEQQQPSSARHRPQSRPVEPSPSLNYSIPGRSSLQTNSSEEPPQPASARSAGRSSSSISSLEQPSSARVVGRPNLRVKTVPMVPSSVSLSLKPVASGNPADSQLDKVRDKKLSLDFGTFKYKEPGGQQSSSALQDELDMLQEENESLLEKLRIAEERFDEAEARTRQLEKQIESLGEGVSLEARLLSRKEADLQKREVALKIAADTYGGGNEELVFLRMEIEAARDEATSALDQLNEAEQEVKSLRITTQRMILTREEMEEVVLKRCWLARCWSLCIRHGIHADIAEARHEYWSRFASRPVEVILAAGRKAKDAQHPTSDGLEERERVVREKEDITKKVDVESMLMVEKGLRELSALKVEEAIAIAMAQRRRPCILKSNMDEVKVAAESTNYSETFGLSPEECEDVLLKQAWLSYLWRRAKTQGLEADIADDRLQFWMNQGNRTPNSHDAVDVERGLQELRKLGMEAKLWEESRRLIDPHSAHKTLLETEYQILS
ncbi:coiled-coil domain-containing protein SCD2-like [Salvia miltiorrhiza]|uniref:coiled-coil domain-containing protein SCD2-like n=1 Tax=Salvia miltiorrhiza TaxID=226208 RepID=UPI0025AD065D|nr:coiled-coil domain-containing protein SCD2-like [Salvia miltiorrhiza]XP_057812296.1 coiled-coil domain-containing protein SCD2-like [Salvia miltiorrhiza]